MKNTTSTEVSKVIHDDDSTRQALWETSYSVAAHGLWPDTPVPFVNKITEAATPHFHRLLDCPIGDGKNAPLLMQSSKVFVGCDTSSTALKQAEARLHSVKSDHSVLLKSNASQLPFSDGYFDAVFCCDLLGHLPDPLSPIQGLLRTLAVSGIIVFNVFSTEDSVLQDSRMEHVAGRDYVFRDSYFFRFYDEKEVRALAERLPLEAVTVEHFKWKEPPHAGYREYEHEHASWVVTGRRV